MLYVLASTGLVAIVVLLFVAGAAGRWCGVRAAGVRGVPFPFGASARWSWATSSFGPQALAAAASILGVYVASGGLMALGTAAAGEDVRDTTSMRVSVIAGGPADAAGMRDGDRVDAVDGQPVASWDGLRAALGAHPGRLDVTVTRDGATKHVRLTPDADGRVQLTAPVAHAPASASAVVGAFAIGPARVISATARGFAAIFAGRERAEVAGPVGITRAVARENTFGDGLRFLAALSAYLLPVVALASALLGPGRRPSGRSGPAPRGPFAPRGPSARHAPAPRARE